mmetsp:Transcript_39512/g.126081  ORF Transcript_39512/g.126081 Transcript_39512/m.126081 type:complete len:280 (-) Transcript_39512:1350-2189(-)
MSSVRDVGDVYYENRPNKTRIWEDVTRYGGRVLTIERGFLGKRDYSLGWNVEDVPCGVGAGVLLPYHYGYNVVNTWRMDDSRLILHDVKIPSEIKPSTHGDAYVLIVGQVPWDTQVQPGVGPLSSVEHCKKEGSCRALVAHKRYSDYVYSHYVGKVIEDIRKYSSRAIVFRPHPKTNKKSTLESWFPNSKVNNFRIDSSNDLQSAIHGAHVVVGFNSNSLLLALLQGRPVVALSNCSLINSCSSLDPAKPRWENLEHLTMPTIGFVSQVPLAFHFDHCN